MYLDNPCAVRGSAAEPEAPREAPHEAPPREAPCEVPCDGVRPCVRLQGSKVPCAVSIYYRVSPKDFTNVSVTNARRGPKRALNVRGGHKRARGSQTRPGGRKRARGVPNAPGGSHQSVHLHLNHLQKPSRSLISPPSKHSILHPSCMRPHWNRRPGTSAGTHTGSHTM